MSNAVALLVSFPNPALKTECKFACELSDTCQNTTIFGGNFIFGDEDFLLVADSYIKKKGSYLSDRNNPSKDLSSREQDDLEKP